jgi:predicted dehydrogenase
LLDRDDVEAVLLVDAQWFGLWPLEQAARLGKPVFCAGSLEEDEDHADTIRQAVAAARLPVLMAWEPALAPAARSLARLVPKQLGEPRLVMGEGSRRGGEGLGPGASSFLAWLLQRAGAAPSAVTAAGVGPGGWATAAFACGDKATVTLTGAPTAGRRGQLRVRVVAERGEAALVSGRRLIWEDRHGRHELTLPRPRRSAAERLLERFHRGLTRGVPLVPGIEEAHQALSWLRRARSATG